LNQTTFYWLNHGQKNEMAFLKSEQAQAMKAQLPYYLGKLFLSHAKRLLSSTWLDLKDRADKHERSPLDCAHISELETSESGQKQIDSLCINAAFPAFRPLKAPKGRIPVAAIVDKITEKCFRYEWELTLLTLADWRAEIEKAKPAFLFVESAWRRKAGTWSDLLTQFAQRRRNALRDLITWCRVAGLPTIFWNTGDPAAFDEFKDAAKEFDWVFTTDANCISKYKKYCGHDRIFALSFAAQPALHNPAGRRDDPNREVAFASRWFDNDSARQKQATALLEAAIELGLSPWILGGFSNRKNKNRNSQHIFAERYRPYLLPSLAYQHMISAYRRFPIFLDVSSVADSATMVSRRIFELLACGTSVLSSPSLAIEKLLPGLVAIATDKHQAVKALSILRADPPAARREAHLGYRTIIREHTYSHRSAQIMRTVFPGSAAQELEPRITVVLTTNRPERLAYALENYRRQRHNNKELVLALNSDDFCLDQVLALTANIPGVRTFQIPERETLATCLNHVIPCATGEFWAKFDDDDLYGAEYLGDSILPFLYTEADVVGKATYFAKFEGNDALYLRGSGNEHKYAQLVCGGTLVVRTRVMEKIKFDESISKGADTDFLRRARQASIKIYSADCYNFIQLRRADARTHTWGIASEEYLRNCDRIVDKYRSDLVFI
jgi:spore maturation protein CgeB